MGACSPFIFVQKPFISGFSAGNGALDICEFPSNFNN